MQKLRMLPKFLPKGIWYFLLFCILQIIRFDLKNCEFLDQISKKNWSWLRMCKKLTMDLCKNMTYDLFWIKRFSKAFESPSKKLLKPLDCIIRTVLSVIMASAPKTMISVFKENLKRHNKYWMFPWFWRALERSKLVISSAWSDRMMTSQSKESDFLE